MTFFLREDIIAELSMIEINIQAHTIDMLSYLLLNECFP